jgi:hypothetical protein
MTVGRRMREIGLCHGFSNTSGASTGTLAAPRMVMVTFRCRQSQDAMKAPTQMPACAPVRRARRHHIGDYIGRVIMPQPFRAIHC